MGILIHVIANEVTCQFERELLVEGTPSLPLTKLYYTARTPDLNGYEERTRQSIMVSITDE